MALVTVVRHNDESFEIESLDAILWNLTGIVKTQRLFLDVGMLVQTGESALTRLDLVVPFRVDSQLQLSDLIPISTELSKQTSILPGLDGGPQTYNHIYSDEAHESDTVQGKHGWSRVPLALVIPIPPNSQGYLRTRLFVVGKTKAVLWKRSGFGINGVVVDLQLGNCSVPERDVATTVSGSPVNIGRCTLNVVLRSSLQMKWSYPESVKPSLLQRGIWEEYLRRRTDFRRQGSLLLYTITGGQESDGSNSVGVGTFLDASREFGLFPLGNFLRIAIVVLGSLFVVGLLGTSKGSISVSDVILHIAHWIRRHSYVTGGGLAALLAISSALSKIPMLHKEARKVRVRLHSIERWMLKALT